MTTRPAETPPEYAPPQPFRLPDIPEKHPDDMTSFKQLAVTGLVHHLARYLSNPETTLVSGERYVVIQTTRSMAGGHYPDLLVAFDVNPAAYEASNGYIIPEQGKAPDFVLEVGSRHTASDDLGVKRDYYERLGVGEYWLYDSEGEFYGFKLKGYRLEDDRYRELTVEEVAPGEFQGYSAALGLNLRAVADGGLRIYDPATNEHIPTFDSQTERAESAEARSEQETARAEAERAARLREAAQSQARIMELEAELRRLRDIQAS